MSIRNGVKNLAIGTGFLGVGLPAMGSLGVAVYSLRDSPIPQYLMIGFAVPFFALCLYGYFKVRKSGE